MKTSEDLETLRRRLRSGNLPDELLRPGREVALRGNDRTLTRDQILAEAGEVAGGLSRLGVRPGDRVGVYAANSFDWVLAYLGSLRAGGCVVPMNPAYRSAEAEHIISNSDPSLVIADIERIGRRDQRVAMDHESRRQITLPELRAVERIHAQ